MLVTTAVLLFCLPFTLSAATSRASAANTAESTKLSFAETSAYTNNSIITNVILVSADGISIGSELEAKGVVTIDKKPLAGSSVALHMGDIVLATTKTNSTGEYAFSAPVGMYYFPAAMWGRATVYSVATAPAGASSDGPSNVTSVTVDPLPFFALIITAVVIALLGLQPYMERFNPFVERLRGKARMPKDLGHEQPHEASPASVRRQSKQKR